MIFQNHFMKGRLGPQDAFHVPADSQVFAVLPPDRLVTSDEVVNLCQKSKDSPKSPKVILNILKSLVKGGKVKEVEGVALQRFAERF